MKFLPVVPSLFPFIFKDITFDIPNEERKIYLTFDDGPHPESTKAILEILDKWDIKATFFCLGVNLASHPELGELIKSKNHVIANHGYQHLNGWTTDNISYYNNFEKGMQISGSNLFRPPYGRIGWNQLSKISKVAKVILWSIMPGDFDPKMHYDQSKEIILKNSRSGSIIVLHDNPDYIAKTAAILHECLPILLKRRFNFEVIPHLV